MDLRVSYTAVDETSVRLEIENGCKVLGPKGLNWKSRIWPQIPDWSGLFDVVSQINVCEHSS